MGWHCRWGRCNPPPRVLAVAVATRMGNEGWDVHGEQQVSTEMAKVRAEKWPEKAWW